MAALSPSPLPPAPRSPTPLRAGALVVRVLRALDAELASALPRVLAGGDAEAIHDLRVAIRRLRTMLKLARPVFGRFHADAVRASFTQVHRATGSLRDEEVLDETLGELASGHPALGTWCERRRARERSLRRAVVHRIRTGEVSRARKMLAALLVLPVDPDRDRAADKLARKAIERARDEVESLRDVPTEDVAGLHELRIAYKGLRYTAELFAPALPSDLVAMADPAARFQKLLGSVHDVDMAIAALKRARGLDPATRTDSLRVLDAARAKKVAKFVEAMAPHVQAAREEELARSRAKPVSSKASSRSGTPRAS